MSFLATFLHLGCVLAFTYTGDIYTLYPAILHFCVIISVHALGVGAILTLEYREKWMQKGKEASGARDYGMSALFQFSMILSAYQLYLAGFALLAGAALLHSATVLISITLSKLGIVSEE